MRLYSIQPWFVYATLCAEGRYQPQPLADPQHWLHDSGGGQRRAYDWLCAQMMTQGCEPPHNATYPVWAYVQWAGPDRPRPDLRTSSMKAWARAAPHVLFELNVPAHRVLVSDYDAWHFALNYWYLGASQATRAFERACRQEGCRPFREAPLASPARHAELMASWALMFDEARVRRALAIRRADQVLQATFWTLEAADVLCATQFGGGASRQPLRLPAPTIGYTP